MTNSAESQSELPSAQSPKPIDERTLRRIRALQNSRRKALRGLSPSKKADEKKRVALSWIYRFGYASPSMIESLVETTRSGYAAALERNGFIKKFRTECGGGISGVPKYICLLTDLGVEFAVRHINMILPYDGDPAKINQQLLRHNEMVQNLTLERCLAKDIKGFWTEREIREWSKLNEKEPDALWISNDDKKIAIEVELSPKTGRRLDEFVRSVWLSVLPNSSFEQRFSSARIYTDSDAIAKNYANIFSEPHFPAPYTKDRRGYWVQIEDTDQDRGDRGEGFIRPEYRNLVRIFRI